MLTRYVLDFYQPEDVQGIISGKLALRYSGREIESMKAVANAHHNRSLQDFEEAKKQFKNGNQSICLSTYLSCRWFYWIDLRFFFSSYDLELTNDAIIHVHLSELYDTLLEQNLSRILEPFSVVEINHVAELIKLPRPEVERK